MAITMGDASALAPRSCCAVPPRGIRRRPVVVYGDAAILRHGAELLGVDVEIEAIDDPANGDPVALQVVDAGLLQAADHRPGVIDAASGAAARQYVAGRDRRRLGGASRRHRDDADEQRGDPARPIRASSATPS